jgi:antitoxin (DNA-binding transcriptional repressor) of toxin-antitoxin stability system
MLEARSAGPAPRVRACYGLIGDWLTLQAIKWQRSLPSKPRPTLVVSSTEEIVITRHDKPVARLVPEGARRIDEVRQAVEGLRTLQQRIRRRSKAKLTDKEVRSAIEQGRR